MKSNEVKHKLIEYRAKGLSYDVISKKLETSKPTLIDWSKELEEEIRQAKAIELEALYEEFYLLKEARIRAFGGVVKKIVAELEKRDLSDVATDKLLELFNRYYIVLREEFSDPIFMGSDDVERAKEEKTLLKDY